MIGFRRSITRIAVLTVAYFITAIAFAYVHLATSPHRYCLAHGQFEERESDPDAPGPRNGMPVPEDGPGHHACKWMAFAASPSEPAVSGLPAGHLRPELPVGVPLPAPVPFDRASALRLAPKASPPSFPRS